MTEVFRDGNQESTNELLNTLSEAYKLDFIWVKKDLIPPNIKLLDARFFFGKIKEKKGWYYVFLWFFVRYDERYSSIPGVGCFYMPACLEFMSPGLIPL